MFHRILSQAAALGLAAMVTLATMTAIDSLATEPVQGSLLAQTPAAQTQLVHAATAKTSPRG